MATGLRQLCEDCKKHGYSPKTSNAKECQHLVAHMGLKWCQPCAEIKQVCQVCGRPTPYVGEKYVPPEPTQAA